VGFLGCGCGSGWNAIHNPLPHLHSCIPAFYQMPVRWTGIVIPAGVLPGKVTGCCFPHIVSGVSRVSRVIVSSVLVMIRWVRSPPSTAWVYSFKQIMIAQLYFQKLARPSDKSMYCRHCLEYGSLLSILHWRIHANLLLLSADNWTLPNSDQ